VTEKHKAGLYPVGGMITLELKDYKAVAARPKYAVFY